MADIFISHVEEDYHIVRDIAAFLEAEGFSTWYYEEHTLPGPPYAIQVGKAIDESQAVILIISLRSISSREMTNEVVRANQSVKHFVPILVDLTHAEFQKRQPEWRQFLGAASAVQIPDGGIRSILPKVVKGLEFLEVTPGIQASSSILRNDKQEKKDQNNNVLQHRLFNEDNLLCTQRFAFSIDEIILRAAKRRNLQGRKLLSVTDLITGMVRKGDLTRFLLRCENVDPDRLYFTLCSQKESGDYEMKPSESSTVLSDDYAKIDDDVDITDISNWIVHNGNQFSPELASLLTHAYDEAAQKRLSEAEDISITEKDLIKCLISDQVWPILVPTGLPSAERVERHLSDLMNRGYINENGAVSLSSLTPEAQRVVTIAHILAQKKGVFPISNRMMLASFLLDKEGYAAKACSAVGAQPEALFALMVLVTEDTEPMSFGLSVEACERIVTPVIIEANRIGADKSAISEQDLFRSFCITADNGFKEFLKQLPMGVDLERLKDIDLKGSAFNQANMDWKSASFSSEASESFASQGEVKESYDNIGSWSKNLFDDTTWRILIESARLAHLQGTQEIRTPHLCAGMINDESTRIRATLKRNGLNPDKIKEILLSLIPLETGSFHRSEKPRIGKNANLIIQLAVDIAHSKNESKVSGVHLETALFADGGGIVGEVMRQLGVAV